MGNSLSPATPLDKRAPEGVVFGPQVGSPITSLEICEALGETRGDILVGTADGSLVMLTLMLASGPEGHSWQTRGFCSQPALPATDGSRDFTTAHAVLPIVLDSNVHAIKGAYCDGKRVYTNIGVAGRSQGARVVKLPAIQPLRKCEEHESKSDGTGENDIETHGHSGPLEYDQFLYADLRENFSLRSSTHILQYKTEVVCLTAQRDGASIFCKIGREFEIPQSYQDGDTIVGLDVRKRDVPTFFDGQRLVIMTTRGSVDNPRSKTRTVTVYGGWGGPYGRREQRRRAARRKYRRDKRAAKALKAKASEAGSSSAPSGAAYSAAHTNDVQVYVHSPERKQPDGTGNDSMENTDEDDEDFDLTRDLYVLAEFKWVMPERRVVWGFDLSETQIVSIHDDRTAKLWDLLDRQHQEPLGEAAMENGPTDVLRHGSRIHGYDFTKSGDFVSVCDGGVVYLWRNGTCLKK